MDPPVPDRGGGQPVVLVVVGTDRHRFDRLMTWLERWHTTIAAPPRLVLQHGFSRRPNLPGAIDFLEHAELQTAMAEATVVISHGGPATITEARRHGHLPIVVPRDPAMAEHVDNHQQLFARRIEQAAMIALCETETTLVATLDRALAEPALFQLTADPTGSRLRAEAVARVGQIVESLEVVRQRSARPRAGILARGRR